MEKLIELLGKIVQALFSSKTLWFIVVTTAIFTLVLLLIANTTPCDSAPTPTPTPMLMPTPTGTPASTPTPTETPAPESCQDFLGVSGFAQKNKAPIGLVALVSIALILAKAVIWIVGLIKDQFFA